MISLTIILPGIIFHLFFMPTLREPESENYQALRNRLAGHSQREEVYRTSLTRFLRWADRFFEGPEEEPGLPDPENLTLRDRFGQRVFFRKYADVPPPEPRGRSWQPNPWSAAAYDRCLLMAVVYPFVIAIICWLTFGTGGELAETIGLHKTADGLYRLVFFICILLGSASLVAFNRNQKHWIRPASLIVAVAAFLAGPYALEYLSPDKSGHAIFVSAFTIPIAFVFAQVFAFAGTHAFIGSRAHMFALVSALAYAGVYLIPFAFVFALVLAISFAWLFAGAKMTNRFGPFVLVFSIMQIVAIGFLLFYAGAETESVLSFSLVFATAILPLVNAPFDWASTGLTRFLLRKNVSETQPVKRALWSCLDFLGALFLLVLLCAAMVIALETTSGIAQSGGFSSPLVDVQALLTDIRDHPGESRHYWLYFAVLSTLIPTFLHLAIWVASTATFQSERLSTWAVPLLDSNFAKGSADRNKLGMALTAQVMAAGAVSLTLLFATLWLLASLFGLGAYLIDMLLWLSGVCQGWFV